MREFDLIKKISEGVPRSGEGLVCGMGDDAAVIEGPGETCWLVTTDIFAEGVHFERGWSDWETLGEKALLVNISDIAAMGGIPWFYFVSVGIPGDINSRDVESFFGGMRAVADVNDMILAGGDTTASKSGFFVSITVVGNALKDNIIYRSGARAGDKIYVSGSLGGSAAGLACLKEGLRGGEYSGFIDRHLLPESRLSLAAFLAKGGYASAMIDISDGLVADLGHIADLSGVGYKVCADKVPSAGGINDVAGKLGVAPLDLIVAGGEDYELLFTVSPDKEKCFLDNALRIDCGCGVALIGEIVNAKEGRKVLDVNGKEVAPANSGFVHEIGG